jgi:type IV pilus assembly protein PilY1
VKKIQLDHNAIVGDVLAVDADLDSKTERIYFGTSYLDTVWKGKLESINIPNQDLSTAWTPTVQNLLYGNFPFTATPAATVDSKGVIWVFAGSGKYEADVDQIDSSQQVFFGFKDLLGSGVTTTVTYPLTISSLDNRTSSSMTGTVNGTTQACMYSQSTQTWQVETMVTSISTANSVAASSLGWYINLGLESSPTLTGERVISKPLAIGGMVDYLTFVPNPDVCSGGGTSYLCSVAFDTGIAPSVVSILSQDVTRGATSGNVTVQKCVSLGSGAPPKNEAIIIPPISNKPPPPVPPGKRKPPANESSGTEKLTKMIQVSTGAIIKIVDNPPISVTSKIFQWLKK